MEIEKAGARILTGPISWGRGSRQEALDGDAVRNGSGDADAEREACGPRVPDKNERATKC